jgi:hypothetical protein
MKPVVVACALAFAACSTPTVENGTFKSDDVNYQIPEPGAGWQSLSLPTANGAWHNDALHASLLVNSHCAGVADSPLEGLTSDLLMGMTDREVLSQQKLATSKREALETVATAKLDGVPRKLMLFVLKKDSCVYDLVLDADPDQFDAARTAYVKMRDGFDVAARPSQG